MADGGSDAVGAGVSSADDDHLLPFGRDVLSIIEIAIEQALGVGVEELHGKVHP